MSKHQDTPYKRQGSAPLDLEEELTTDPIVKRISTEIVFDSDGETEIIENKRDIELSDIFSNYNDDKIIEDLNIQKDYQMNPKFKFGNSNFGDNSNGDKEDRKNSISPIMFNHYDDDIQTGLNEKNYQQEFIKNFKQGPSPITQTRVNNRLRNSTPGGQEFEFDRFEEDQDFQFKVEKFKLKEQDQENRRRKFSGIEEDDYFVFVEDYDKFIGEFVSDQNLKIVRGFINANKFDRIYYTKMIPENRNIKANLLMVHGFGHSGKYLDLGAALSRQGMVVHLFDIRGFGFSGGNRFNPKISDIHEDILLIMKNSMNKKLPLFMYGHSYGASILFILLLRNQFNIAGVILSSMMLSIQNLEYSKNGKLKKFLTKHFGDFFKDFVINNIVNPTALTKNSFNIKRFVDDRICVPFLGLRFVSQLTETFDIIKSRCKEFEYPVLVIHGMQDQVCNYKLMDKLYSKIESEDKKKIFFEKGFHEPFLDDEIDKYKTYLIQWINQRISKSFLKKGPDPLGDIKNAKIGIKSPKKFTKIKIFISILVFALYAKGFHFVKQKKFYQNNPYLRYIYPLFWTYKLFSMFIKSSAKNVSNFFLELFKETKLVKIE